MQTLVSWFVAVIPAALPRLLDLVLAVTLVLLLAAAVLIVGHRSGAATRHLILGAALVGVLALPVFSGIVPRWSLPGAAAVAERTREIVAARPTPPPATESAVGSAPAPTRAAVTLANREAARSGRDLVDRGASLPSPADRVNAAAAGASLSWAAWIVLLWIGGTTLILVTVVASVLRTASLSRGATPAEARVAGMAREVARRLGIRRSVRVLLAPGACMPMTWGAVRPVVLVPRDVRAWPAAQLRSVLLHELAHVKRWDYLTQLLARVACAVYWFHPLVWLAARRLRVERELACDDLVLTAGSRASDYAGYLLDIARSLRATPLSVITGVAMARPSQLSGRLLAVLDAGRRRSVVTRRVTVGAAVVAGAVVLPLAGATSLVTSDAPAPAALEADMVQPALTSPTLPSWTSRAVARRPEAVSATSQGQGRLCDWVALEHTSASTSIDDDDVRIRIESDACGLELRSRGHITFSADGLSVVGLAGNGLFDLVERVGRQSRRLEIRPGDGNALEWTWYVDGDRQWRLQGSPTDVGSAEARAWLSSTLLVLYRRSGFRAAERAAFLLERHGVQGVLDEVALLQSDYAAGRYYAALLSRARLEPALVRRIVEEAGQRIESDHTLAELLVAVATSQTLDENVRVAYVAAAGSIDSDYQRRRVLSTILKRQDLTTALATALLQSATAIESDHELAELLLELIAAHPIDAAMSETFFRAVGSIESDYQRRRVLSAMLAKGSPSQAVLDQTLELAQGMSSDHELSNLLIEVASRYPVSSALPASYVRAARTIGSDYQQGRVWQTLIARGNLSQAALAGVLDAAATIASDHERGNLLLAVASRHTIDDAVRPAFFRALELTASDYQRARVLVAVVAARPAPATAYAVVRATEGIASDHHRHEVLSKVIESVSLTDELREAVLRAIDGMGSQYQRGRLLDQLRSRPG